MKKIIFFLSISICLFVCALFLTTSKSKASSPKFRLNVKSVELTKRQRYILRVYNAKKVHKIYFHTEQEGIVSLPKVSAKAKKIQITAKNTGSTTIFVTIKRKKQIVDVLSCKVTVTPQAISIKFKKKNIEMTSGTTLLLKPIIKPNNSSCVPIYKSSDERVATVNAKGRVFALTGGETTITATLPNGQSTSCNLIVWEAPWIIPSPPKKIDAPPAP